MRYLYLEAPFAAFRTFTGGSFRPTAGFITPSAVYGLLLNAAGLEMRYDDGRSPMTLIGKGLPRIQLAIAALEWPGRHSLLQQLHNYPIGKSGEGHAGNTKGSKYNIIPVRREFLSGVRAYIGFDCDEELEKDIVEGLAGRRSRAYGLPFLGDSNFLIDRLEPVEKPQPAFWFERVEEEQEGFRDHITRVTVTIDRADLSRIRSTLYAPCVERTTIPPAGAWVEVCY